jgi:8-oxo-dGTP pyrophosphatase MutT (NUDIX family)
MSPYVTRMRAAIGVETLLLPSVAVLPRDELGRLLLVHQADSGRWGCIGGAVEPDEDPATAAVRETAEEAGVHVELTGLLAAIGGPECRVVYPGGDQASYVVLVYGATVLRGRPRPDLDEVLDVAWLLPDALESLALTSISQYVLRSVGLLQQ